MRGIVGVVAVGLARGEDVQRVVRVVVPLRRGAERARRRVAREVRGRVAVVLQHDVHGARASRALAERVRDLGDDVGDAVVDDRVDGVEAQPVEPELLDPVQRVVHEEIAHRPRVTSVEIDRRPPWRRTVAVEEPRRVGVEVVSLRAEVVVDDVEEHHQAAGVRRRDQALQVLRRAVRGVGRERQHAVVAPVARAGEVGDRHQLDCRDAEVGEVVEPFDRGGKRPAGREGPDVELVDHRLFPRPAGPGVVAPLERAGVHDPARAVDVVGIPARGRIGDPPGAADVEAIRGAGRRVARHELEPAVREARHRPRGVVAQDEPDPRADRRPQPEPRLAAGPELGAERHLVAVLHRLTPAAAGARPPSAPAARMRHPARAVRA